MLCVRALMCFLLGVSVFLSGGVALCEESVEEQLHRLTAEVQMLRSTAAKLAARNEELQKENDDLRRQLKQLSEIAGKYGVEVPSESPAPETPPAEGQAPAQAPALNSPLNEEQKAVLKQLTGKIPGEKQPMLRLNAMSSLAITLAEYGQSDECGRCLRQMATEATAFTEAKALAGWQGPSYMSSCALKCARAFAENWKAPELGMDTMKDAAQIVKGDSFYLASFVESSRTFVMEFYEGDERLGPLDAVVQMASLGIPGRPQYQISLAETCEKVAAETKNRQHKLAALRLYRASVKADATSKTAWERIRALEGELGIKE